LDALGAFCAIKASRCAGNVWQCRSGQCIDASLVCNGEVDCEDRSDEFLKDSEDAYYCNVTGVDFVLPTAAVEGVDVSAVMHIAKKQRKMKNEKSRVLCSEAGRMVGEAVDALEGTNTVGDEWDTQSMEYACGLLYSCIIDDREIYTSMNDECAKFENFVSANQMIADYASRFARLFNVSCPPPPPETRGGSVLMVGVAVLLVLIQTVAMLG
jgi:hypothetical protein